MDTRVLIFKVAVKLANNPAVHEAVIQGVQKTTEVVTKEAVRQGVQKTAKAATESIIKNADKGTEAATARFNPWTSGPHAIKGMIQSPPKKALAKFAVGTAASIPAANVGAAAGAAVGTFLMPGLGTAVGSFVGAWGARIGTTLATDSLIEQIR